MAVSTKNLKDEEAAIEPSESKKGGFKGVRVIPIYLAVAAVMIIAGYFVGSKVIQPSDKTTTEDGNRSAKTDHAARAESEIYMMEDIIVNPSGTGGTRFLSVSVGFEVSSEETLHLLENREAVIKDALITILGSKTIEQLSDAREKEITRYQIKRRVEQLLHSQDLLAVYFTDFILQ